MSNNISVAAKPLPWQFWFTDKRAQVYLAWLVLIPIGYVMTHLHTSGVMAINAKWVGAAIVGFAVMAWVMPLKQRRMQLIFVSWLIPITLGLILSVAAFMAPALYWLAPTLGVLWVALQAIAFAANGIVDAPSGWYWFAVGLHVVLLLALLLVPTLLGYQYLLLAIVTAWSLLNLWLFRSPSN